MPVFVAALLYLVPTPFAVQLREMVRWLLNTILETLVDLESGRLRDLPPGYLARMDEMLQDAEVWIAQAVWLRAHALAGGREPPSAAKLPTRARASQTADRLLARIASLARIIRHFERCARRTLARITAPPRERIPVEANSSAHPGAVHTGRALDLSG